MYNDGSFEFTLFDFAKVVVLIGLLSGVTLIGIHMTNAAKIRDFAGAINRMDTAAMAFRLKYQYVPGDLPSSKASQYGLTERNGGPGRGDGNGLVEYCYPTQVGLGCESGLYWRDLAQANMIGKTTFNYAIDNLIDGTAVGFNLNNYLPKVPFREQLFYFMYPLAGHNAYYIGIIPAVGATGEFTPKPGLTAREAYGIDEKMDDGTPTRGNVQAMTSPLVIDPGALNTKECASIANSGEISYNSESNVVCQLSIRSGL